MSLLLPSPPSPPAQSSGAGGGARRVPGLEPEERGAADPAPGAGRGAGGQGDISCRRAWALCVKPAAVSSFLTAQPERGCLFPGWRFPPVVLTAWVPPRDSHGSGWRGEKPRVPLRAAPASPSPSTFTFTPFSPGAARVHAGLLAPGLLLHPPSPR